MVRPTVALFSKPDGVGLRLVELLISNLNSVKILSPDENPWRKSLGHLHQKNLIEIINPKKGEEFVGFEYLIIVDLDLVFSPLEILDASRMAASQSARILIILPYVAEGLRAWQKREKIRGLVLKKIPEAGIVYAGEVYGPRYFSEDKNFITRNMTKAFTKKEVEALEETPLYPITVEAVCRYISRNIFSFGPYGKEVVVYSQEIPSLEFLSLLARLVGETTFEAPKFSGERQEVLGVRPFLTKSDFEKNFKETVSWFRQNNFGDLFIKKKRGSFYFLRKGAFVGALMLVFAPFFLEAIGGFTALLALNSIKKGKAESVKRNLLIAKEASRGAKTFFSVYGQVPVFSKIYRPFIQSSNVLTLGTEIAFDGAEIVDKSRELIALVLGESVYDPAPLSQEISLSFDKIYQEASFLESELNNLSPPEKKVLSRFIKEGSLESLRPKILGLKTLFEKAPEILGKESPRTYLVLFQNNMELRPTGGFIGSFALVSFDGGRLIDINVLDVYAADGQLKGHVEPPSPIRKYLGEANWFLRDSNWDPDFPTSAARAEWFLEKEMDKKVDGVVGLDLEVVKGLLAATGPVVLSDFNQALDYKNLYERLQGEVEEGFFPGSQKKAGLLTALTREIMNRLSSLAKDKYFPVGRELAKNLEERHLQIYFNEPALERAIALMDYAGEIKTASCFENCFPDWLVPVDANVGVTKANYFIERGFKLETTVAEGVAKKRLEITYKNTANPALGPLGRYRTYTRIFVPVSSFFGKVKIENAGVAVETDPETETLEDRKSGGINVEISPGQTKKLIFSWETTLPQNLTTGEYRLFVRKQAGTGEDPLEVSILTPQESNSYNTVLARDFVARTNF